MDAWGAERRRREQLHRQQQKHNHQQRKRRERSDYEHSCNGRETYRLESERAVSGKQSEFRRERSYEPDNYSRSTEKRCSRDHPRMIERGRQDAAGTSPSSSMSTVPSWLHHAVQQKVAQMNGKKHEPAADAYEQLGEHISEVDELEEKDIDSNGYIRKAADLSGVIEASGVKQKQVLLPYFSSLWATTNIGCRSVDCFERIGTISEGSYGVVHRARDKRTEDIVALKKIKIQGDFGFPITSLREINLLMAIDHPNIMGLREVVLGRNHDSVYMVMDYFPHELKALMQAKQDPFTQSEVKCLMQQFLAGVAEMHSQWIIHRDLKTSNLLMDSQGILKICDLGLARKFGSPIEPYTPLVVTLWYRAPELLLGATTYSTPVDMWSVGCIFAELLIKKPLFEGAQGEFEQLNKIFSLLGTPDDSSWPEFSSLPYVQKFNWKRHPRGRLAEMFPRVSFAAGASVLSDSGVDLLERMLTFDPKKRISAQEALQHEWFTQPPLPQDPALISLTLPALPRVRELSQQ